jgi:hypothetical protein
MHVCTPAALLLVPLFASTLLACSASGDGLPLQDALSTSPSGLPSLLPSKATNGPQLFVATNGDDGNPGTKDQPWRTIQKAMDSATPGSTVNIRAGTYNERLSVNVSGATNAPIVFQPYGFGASPSCGGYTGADCAGENVVLDYGYLGTVGDSTPTLSISNRQHILIQGIVFQNFTNSGTNGYGIRIGDGSSDVELSHVKVLGYQNSNWVNGFTAGALQVVRVEGASTSDIRFRYSEFGNTRSNWSETLTFDLGSHDGLVEGSWFHDTDGIATGAYQNANHLTFRDNRFEFIGYKRDGTAYYPGVDAGIAIYNDCGHDFLAEGNTISDSSLTFENMSEPWCIGQGWDSYDVVFRNNVSIDNRGSQAITVGTWYTSNDPTGRSVHDVQIYNNTIYGAQNIAIKVLPFGANVVVRNNIVANSGGANYTNDSGFDVGATFDYNLYAGGNHGPDAHQVNGDPKFANPAAGNFSLLPGSPAIGEGDPATTAASAGDVDALGAPRFSGGRVSVGAIQAH